MSYSCWEIIMKQIIASVFFDINLLRLEDICLLILNFEFNFIKIF